MPEFHAEPYIYLPALSHKSVLVAWGAFYFRVKSRGEFKLVNQKDLNHVHPRRVDTIGARSSPYGPAVVEIFNSSGALVATGRTEVANHCWVTGLTPDTEYTYRISVNGEEWAAGERWDWSPSSGGLVKGHRYHNRFRTHPDPTVPATSLSFAVIGDFGVGVKTESPDRRQREVGIALQDAVEANGVRLVLTTGDNIYAGKKFLGLPIGQTGGEDDDWFFTYFQPYRFVINQIPVYPSIGNHDTGESEDNDDRAQVEDNFYVRERIAGEEAAGRASLDPGLFYRFRYGSEIEFVCIDTSKENIFKDRLFELPKHRIFLEAAFPASPGTPSWRIPFCHHPPFSAGPRHHNTESMHSLVPLFQRSGVRAVFSGHEHNFQHSIHAGIHYFVSGAAGKRRDQVPNQFERAHTQSWSSECHFLLATISGHEMAVRAIGERTAGSTMPSDIARRKTDGTPADSAMHIGLA